jgi:hypothetical protein
LALAGLEAWLACILAGGPEGIKAIIKIFCLDNWTFNGLGCHTAMDALYVAVVHPAMTCFALCASDVHFTHFKAALLECFDCDGSRVYPYFSAVPDHGHVLRSRISDLCLFSDILDITDLPRTFAFQAPVLSDQLCSLRVA